ISMHDIFPCSLVPIAERPFVRVGLCPSKCEAREVDDLCLVRVRRREGEACPERWRGGKRRKEELHHWERSSILFCERLKSPRDLYSAWKTVVRVLFRGLIVILDSRSCPDCVNVIGRVASKSFVKSDEEGSFLSLEDEGVEN